MKKKKTSFPFRAAAGMLKNSTDPVSLLMRSIVHDIDSHALISITEVSDLFGKNL